MKHRPTKLVMTVALWLGSLTLIAISTLSPFTFNLHDLNLKDAISLGIRNPTNPIDIVANIILFLPLGFSSYALTLRLPRRKTVLCLMSIGVLSTSISILVETAQLFLPGRFPTLSDIVFNGFGGFLGGLFALQLSIPKDKRFPTKLNKTVCLIAFLGYFLSIYLGLFLFTCQIQISNWQTSYPLTIGNTATGDNPWLGKVSNILLFDSALTSDSIGHLLNFKLDSTSYKSLAFSCLLEPDIIESNYLASELHLCKNPTPQKKLHPQADNDVWYLVESSNLDFINRIKSNKAFTIALKIKSEFNRGFGTVLTIAEDIDHVNFILGIQANRLTSRIRFPLSGVSGKTPELVIHDKNLNSIDQTIVIVYDSISFHVYQNHLNQEKQASLLADLYFTQPLSKIYREWRLELFNIDLHKWLFIAFTFTPAIVLFELLQATGKINSSREISQCVIGLSILAALISRVYTSSLNIWIFEWMEVLAILLFCWFGTKLYFITLEKYQL
ncbi:VanZ family protein [Acaryochloris marina]|uniref:VanZ like family protein, putative n=1 Tax=Acaryochloris marina (strain MBIC 11017) TaxID=329726 RepID=B0CFI2_ACAM1|nr:VanZ family protein [Acaryochloris marina]ABW27001.1 vanZ like family protein, putative [Acaryochloris marina MBIC11017]